MALMECPECGHKVSTEAASCPNCGKPTRLVFTPRSKKKKPERMVSVPGVIFIGLLLFGVWGFTDGWLPALFRTKADLQASVQQMMQSKFDDTPGLQIYHLHVDEVDLIHIDGPRYKGIATITANGEKHQIPVDVTADGDHIMYQADSASLLPIALGQ